MTFNSILKGHSGTTSLQKESHKLGEFYLYFYMSQHEFNEILQFNDPKDSFAVRLR